MMPDMMKAFVTHPFVRAPVSCIDIMLFRVFRVTVLVFGCSPTWSTERHLRDLWQLGNFSIRQIADSCGGRRWMQRQNFHTGILFRSYKHCWGSYSAPVLTQSTYKITRLVSNYCIWIKCFNVWHLFQAHEHNHCLNGGITAEALRTSLSID